jgi:hypothetical protein
MEGNALIQNTTRHASARRVTTRVTLNDQFDADDVQTHKQDVEPDPPHRQHRGWRAEDARHVAADEIHDDGWRQHVLDVFRQPGQESAPKAQGLFARTNTPRPYAAAQGDISARENVSPRYMMAMTTVARNMLPQPFASPRFHPEKCPEITAPTPNAQSDQTPA